MRWPDPSRQPQTSASSCSREKTVPGRDGQQGEQVELGRRQVHDLAAGAHQPRCRDRSRSSPRRSDVAGRRGAPLDAPQQRPYAGDELTRRERLGHVVVGADGEADEHVGLLRAGRQHQHRHRPVALHAAADLEPVEAREHQIEDHEVGPHALAQRDAGVPVVRDLDDEPLGAQPGGDGGGDHDLVLDHADQRPVHATECVTAICERAADPVVILCKS